MIADGIIRSIRNQPTSSFSWLRWLRQGRACRTASWQTPMRCTRSLVSSHQLYHLMIIICYNYNMFGIGTRGGVGKRCWPAAEADAKGWALGAPIAPGGWLQGAAFQATRNIAPNLQACSLTHAEELPNQTLAELICVFRPFSKLTWGMLLDETYGEISQERTKALEGPACSPSALILRKKHGTSKRYVANESCRLLLREKINVCLFSQDTHISHAFSV